MSKVYNTLPMLSLPAKSGRAELHPPSQPQDKLIDIERLVKAVLGKHLDRKYFLGVMKFSYTDIYYELLTLVWHEYQKGMYNPNRGAFGTWVYTRVIWGLKDLSRGTGVGGTSTKRKSKESYNAKYEDAAELDENVEAPKSDNFILISRLLERLPPDDREFIIDRFFRNSTLADIGLRRGVTREAVRLQERKILQKLQILARQENYHE